MRRSEYAENCTISLREVGTKFTNPRDIKDYLKAKNSCILTRSIGAFIQKFAPYISTFADIMTKRIVKLEQEDIESAEMSFIPTTLSEFKNNTYYTLPSLIKKYQGFLPASKALENKTFKGEPIYLKKDLTELHTRERWRKHGRQVRKTE